MDYNDSDDILGGNVFPVIRPEPTPYFSWAMLGRLFIILIIAACLKLFLVDFRRYWKKSRENAYKRSMRRRYGIPDDNNEPFNVAYAQVIRARDDERRRRAEKEEAAREAAQRKEDHMVQLNSQIGASHAQPTPVYVPPMRSQATAFVPPQPFAVVKPSIRPPIVQEAYSNYPETQSHGTTRAGNTSFEGDSTARSDVNGVPSVLRQRHVNKDGTAKISKSNLHRPHDIIDVDREQVADHRGADEPPSKPVRGAKRQAGDEPEESFDSISPNKMSKRARRQSKKNQSNSNENESQDILMDLDPISRGKKRDRAEAGSSFGGDDEPSVHRKNRRRKGKLDADVLPRGIKRSFGDESTLESDEDEQMLLAIASRKRGKMDDSIDSTDISFDDTSMVKDPACGGRSIGKEWQAKGQRFKVGPDGRRLRQVLLKKRRSRFSMPQDSQHPDSNKEMEVVVETWLTDEDFKAAEDRGAVFHPSKDGISADEVEDYSLENGKGLLWSSPRKPAESPKKAFKDSIITNIGLNLNPFEKSSYAGYSRRVSTGNVAFKPPAPPTVTPTLRSSKSYSKWEKQDLEAEAIVKLRKKTESEDLAKSSKKSVTFDTQTPGAAPSIASSFSAPADLSKSSSTFKSDASAFFKPSNLFNSLSAKPAGGSSSETTAQPTESDAAKSANVTLPQPEKSFNLPEQPKLPIFTVTPAEKTSDTTSNPGLGVPSFSSPASSFSFGNKAPDNMPGKEKIPNFFANFSSAATKDTSGSTSSNPSDSKTATTPSSGNTGSAFSIKGAAQAEKAPSFAFPTASSSEKPTTVHSVFGVRNESTNTGDSGSGNGVPSLLSRLGGFANTPATAGMTMATTSAPTPPSNPFGAASTVGSTPAPPATQNLSNSSSSAQATTTPKFSFGFSSKPAATAPVTPASNGMTSMPAFTAFTAPASTTPASTTPASTTPASTTPTSITSVSTTPASSTLLNVPSAAPVVSSEDANKAIAAPVFKFNVTPAAQSSTASTTSGGSGLKYSFGQTGFSSTPAAQVSNTSDTNSNSSAPTPGATTTPTTAPQQETRTTFSFTASSGPNPFKIPRHHVPSPLAKPAISADDSAKPTPVSSSGTTSQPNVGANVENKPFVSGIGNSPIPLTRPSGFWSKPSFKTINNPYAGSTKPSTSAFGGYNAFGGSSGTSAFGTKPADGTKPVSAFGSSRTSVFGAKPADGTSAFGVKPSDGTSGTKPADGTSVFGAKPVDGSQPVSAFGSLAGSSGTSISGAKPADGTSVFGAKPTESTSVFGAKSADGTSVFGAKSSDGASVFGAKPADGTSVFGAKPADGMKSTPVFGTPSGFGSSGTSVFGVKASEGPKPSVFSSFSSGTTPSAFGSAFGSSAFGKQAESNSNNDQK